MKRPHFLMHPIVVFVLAQIAWLSVVGLWIYWYISNYIIFNMVDDKIAPKLVPKSFNVVALVGGLVLLVAILVGFYMIFIYLTRQINLTRLYDNFIANVTHELKSPLASIQLYLETLSLRNVSPEKQNEFIKLMIKDANRLENLINTILEIASLEQKKIAHNYHIYSAENVVREIIKESAEQFKVPDKSINVTGAAPCRCVIDRNALRIVFDNLFDNAIKYSLEPVRINIHLTCKLKAFVIEFSDNGIGIAAKDQKKIFSKFQRIYRHEIPSVTGTGLGLYWVKEIIKYHGGKISVFSKGPGAGTTFRIELPVYQAAKRSYVNKLLELTKRREMRNSNRQKMN